MRGRRAAVLACAAAGAVAYACGSSDLPSIGGGDAGAPGDATPPPQLPPPPPPPTGSGGGEAGPGDGGDASTDAGADGDADAGFDAGPNPDAGVIVGHQLAVGDLHTCRIKLGAIKCWGGNANGQLGDGNTGASSPPVDVTGITTAVEIAAGADFTCARLASGGVKCWGAGDNGKLGNNIEMGSPTPVDVFGVTDAIAIASGAYHTCIIRSNQHVACWGQNGNRIGDGQPIATEPYVLVPTEPSPKITDAIAISAGYSHTCVLHANGTASCWGLQNTWGQIGDGTTTDRPTPVDVITLSAGDQLALGTSHSCARQTDAGILCWGNNQSGQLGLGGRDDLDHPPTVVPGLPPVARVQPTGFGTCAITTTGTTYCWGENPGVPGKRFSAQTVSGLGPTIEIEGKDTHTCARLANGELWCWGDNQFGALGADAGNKSDTPVLAPGL
jgi:alpha-tubulin suppressor-like RCC1 family protein